MTKYAVALLIFIFSSPGLTSDWTLVSSRDAFWIKTVNQNQYELLLAYQDDEPQFMLILASDRKVPDKPIPVKIKIDKGKKLATTLIFLEGRAEQSIFRIAIDKKLKEEYIVKMVEGLGFSIFFESATDQNAEVLFSLSGFTVALNDLLIGKDIGSLDTNWLLEHKKDHELYCLMTTNIFIKALGYRVKGYDYAKTLHLIPQTNYSIIDSSLPDIISHAYNIPYEKIAYEPRAEKYLMFKRCMTQQAY